MVRHSFPYPMKCRIKKLCDMKVTSGRFLAFVSFFQIIHDRIFMHCGIAENSSGVFSDTPHRTACQPGNCISRLLRFETSCQVTEKNMLGGKAKIMSENLFPSFCMPYFRHLYTMCVFARVQGRLHCRVFFCLACNKV